MEQKQNKYRGNYNRDRNKNNKTVGLKTATKIDQQIESQSNKAPRTKSKNNWKKDNSKLSSNQKPPRSSKYNQPDNNRQEANQDRQSKPKLLKVCALGGTEEVGRNSNFIELGNDIIMVDCGLAFPTVEHYGVDYIIPNTGYLKKKKKGNIRGILLTHGHLDHIGALPYILPDLGFPTIYASDVANKIVRARLSEFKMDKQVRLVNVNPGDTVKLGLFKATFNHVTHSIPGCYSIFVESPVANVFISGDYKIDRQPLIENQTDYSAHEKLKGRVDLALMESTRANTPGHSKTEKDLQDTLHKIVTRAKGRVVIASFASNISRMYIAGIIAQRTGRKVFVSGRSSINMLELARQEGYLKGISNLFLPATEMRKYKDNQVLFLCTGSQGERYGALNRISLNEHKQFRVKRGDLIIRSSSDIPGNELDIEGMTSRLIRHGADLINNKEEEVHYGGHGSREDMKRMFDLIKPRNVMPVHGHMTLRYFNKQNLLSWGLKDANILMTDDGVVWSTTDGKSWKKADEIDAKPVLVDGLGVGDIGDVVLKDREQLSEFGMVVTILNLSSKSKALIGKPRFVSRGFVYLKTSKELFDDMEKMVIDIHQKWKEASKKGGKFEYTKLSKELETKLAKFIYKKTEREPMMLTYIT